MRFEKFNSWEEMHGQYCLIIDALPFCDLYAGRYNCHTRCLDGIMCPTNSIYYDTEQEQESGITFKDGIHFSQSFCECKQDKIFKISKEQYEKISTIKSANLMRQIKAYCY